VLAVALVLSIVGYLQFLSSEIAPNMHLTKFGYVFKVFRPQFYLFFCIGIAVRMYAGVLKFSRIALVAGVLIGFGFYLSCFFYPNLYISTISFFVLNICLAIFILQIAEANNLKKVKSLEWLGVNSLPVYLWHVVPLLIVQETIVYKNNEPVFYLASIAGLCIIIIIIKLLTKVPVINKYVFGSRV
jgi:acyltransferase